jgi:hypothetical protein
MYVQVRIHLPYQSKILYSPKVSQANNFDTDDEFTWSGADDGVAYSADTPKIGNNTLYSLPSCFHICIECNEECITLPPFIHSIFNNMRCWSIGVLPTGRIVVANSGATNHMPPDILQVFLYFVQVDFRIEDLDRQQFLCPCSGPGEHCCCP